MRPPIPAPQDWGGGAAYIAYRKREQALYNKSHPDRPDTLDWDSEEMREAYGGSA